MTLLPGVDLDAEEREVLRAQKAKMLLDDPLLQEAFAYLEETYRGEDLSDENVMAALMGLGRTDMIMSVLNGMNVDVLADLVESLGVGVDPVAPAAAAAEEALGSSATATVAERAGLLGAAATYRYELGEERAARPHLEAYVALRPDDSKALFRLGSSLLTIANTPQGSPPPYVTAQRDAEQAAEAFRRCYTLAPGDVDAAIAMSTAWVRAAELADLQGNAEERDALRDRAGAHLAELAAKFPKNAEVQFCIGALAELQARPKVAQAAYVASLDRDDDHLGSLMNLAALVAADGKLDSARSLYARLLAAPKAQVSLTRRERQRIERWLLDAAKAPADGGDGAQTAPDRRERS